MLLGTSTTVHGVRKDEDTYGVHAQADNRESGCPEVAAACGLAVEDFNRDRFMTCCTTAEWDCEKGKCKHSNLACTAAASEIFDEGGEDGSVSDCDGAMDLVTYHFDHAASASPSEDDLEESSESGLLERDLDGTVMAKGGSSGGKGGKGDDPELPEFEDDYYYHGDYDEGLGHCRSGEIYSSRAWELASSSGGQKGFDTPEYASWRDRAWELCTNRNAEVHYVSVWRDAGYRCYTTTNCQPNGDGNTKSWSR